MAAPRGAVFIWHNDDLTYPRYLARKHRREDLNIMPLSLATVERFRPLRSALPPAIVLDHEVVLDRDTKRAYRYLTRCIDRILGEMR